MTRSIEIRRISKSYRLGETHSRLLSERLGAGLRDLYGRIARRNGARPEIPPKDAENEIWALRDVSLEVNEGEVVGIIGSNGAGKSTLLKVLSRITPPTAGEVELRGRVASLLEVGTGFHPELTGRENIFLNGAILGMTRAEVRGRFDEIVSFAEVERFIDTPVKRYSSGMHVRLAFAVAAHLEPEILIVDEVLAVGDARFQKKCLGKMGDVSTLGRTVLFVSHNMGAIRSLCHRAVVLRDGSVDFDGAPPEGVERYLRDDGGSAETPPAIRFHGPLSKRIEIESVRINGRTATGSTALGPDVPIRIQVCGRAHEAVARCQIAIGLEKDGTRIATTADTPTQCALERGSFQSDFLIEPFLLRPGDYTVSAGAVSDSLREWTWGRDLGRFTVLQEWSEKFCVGMDGFLNIPSNGGRAQ